MSQMSISTSIPIEQIKDNTHLWYKIRVFIYDLRNFRERQDSNKRLESIADASYIGMPYFSTEEADTIRNSINHEGKTLTTIIEDELNERLERRMKKRVQSQDFRVCCAHDLAPIFEKAFSIRPKDLKVAEFVDLIDRNGLCYGAESPLAVNSQQAAVLSTAAEDAAPRKKKNRRARGAKNAKKSGN